MATYLESVEAQRKKREGQPIVRPWVDRTRQEFAEMSGRAFAGSDEVARGVQGAKDLFQQTVQGASAKSDAYRDRLARSVTADTPAGRQLGEVLEGDSRGRRLEMAGYAPETQRRPNMPQPAPEAPVMSNNTRTETGLRNEGPPEQAAYGVGQQPDQRTMPGKASQAITTSAAASGRVPAASSDPRSRYMSMAKMGLEEREKYLNSLPVGQRPIQVIRGNTESWYSPGMSREFATIPEAMSGVQGRPTYESEEQRAERAAGRASMSSRQQAGFANQRSMQAAEFAHQEKMAKDFGITSLKGGKGSARGAGGEKWKVDITADQDGRPIAFMSDEGSGKNVQVKIGDANSVGGALPNFNMEDSRTRQLALDMLNGLGDVAAIESTYKNQPEHVQTAILQAIKERKEAEKKK